MKCYYEELKKSLGDLKLIIFDMDGVLVDVRSSYIRAIKETVEYFCNNKVMYSDINILKAEGGFNDDWDLSCELIKRNGIRVNRKEVIDFFQGLYWGDEGGGFIKDETWLFSPSLKEFFTSKSYILSIFTGRPRREALHTLKLNDALDYFSFIVGMEDVEKGKPDPEGLNKILSKFSCSRDEALYIGDTIDDITAARLAGIHSLGIYSSSSSVFEEEGAIGVFDSIEELIYML